MDLYNTTAYQLCRQLTNNYSTSFGSASRLFDKNIRDDIYAIYAFSRLGDEVVDTYKAKAAGIILEEYRSQTYAAITYGYSTNPVLQAFQKTAQMHGIDETLLEPYFTSMAMDLTPKNNCTQAEYEAYIHGSAEVIGLMCLRVFVGGNQETYEARKKGAMHLGAALQKINFLRDFAADNNELKRTYFPGVDAQNFTEADKQRILADIQNDLALALPDLKALPKSARAAVMISYRYFEALAIKLQRTPADIIMRQRLSVSNTYKLWIFVSTAIKEKYL